MREQREGLSPAVCVYRHRQGGLGVSPLEQLYRKQLCMGAFTGERALAGDPKKRKFGATVKFHMSINLFVI